MYDENAYKDTYKKVNPLQCVFERAVLRRCVSCHHARKHLIAEREAMGCENAEARAECEALRQHLKTAAVFVLKLTHVDAPIPHVKELKLQCGGLLGLVRLAEPDALAVDDVYATLTDAIERYGSIASFPYQEIIPTIRGFEPRVRR